MWFLTVWLCPNFLFCVWVIFVFAEQTGIVFGSFDNIFILLVISRKYDFGHFIVGIVAAAFQVLIRL